MSVSKNTFKWSSKEINLLHTLFPTEKKELILKQIKRSWGAIYQTAKKYKINRVYKLHKRNHKNWPPEDIEKLYRIYSTSNNKQLEAEFPNKKIHAIDEYANKRGLKKDLSTPFSKGRKGDLKILLKECPESYYWIGFIFADGYIHHKSNHLVIFIDKLDKYHLQKYADYISGKIKVYTEIKRFGKNSLPYESTMCRVAVAQKLIVPQIIDKFNFLPNKTYNPPNADFLKKVLDTKDKFIAFLAGFIDGDGSMYSHCIKIENHASWKHIHKLFIDMFVKFFNFKIEDFFIEINKKGYSVIEIRNNSNLARFKTNLLDLNLPLLKRKWDKINEKGICKKEKELILENSILSSIKNGETIPEMSKSLKKSEPTLRSYIHRKKINYNRIYRHINT